MIIFFVTGEFPNLFFMTFQQLVRPTTVSIIYEP